MTTGKPAAYGDDSTPTPGAAKQEWRRWARKQRSDDVTRALSEAVTDWIAAWLSHPEVPAGTVALYLPLPDEVDVTPLIDRTDRPCAVTRTPSRGPLTLHPADSPLERHRYGFEQPVADSLRIPAERVGLVLVPGLAFDLRGERLGRGGGYYDRFLPTLRRGALRVGVIPDSLVVGALPTEPHDVAMTHLATESGVRNLAHH